MKRSKLKDLKNKIGLKFNSPIHKGSTRNYIFIHINKTAGTSIVDIIGKPFRKHLTAKEIISFVGEKKYHEAYKFTVVRNPWDKVVSHYKHRIKTNPNRMLLKESFKNGKQEFIPFKEWVACTFGEPKDPYYYNRPQHFLPQVEWLKDEDGNMDIDTVIKFENLNEDFGKVSEDLGLNAELPHLNKTKKTNYREFYDDETKEIIADWFKEDIKTFGYKY